TLQGLTINGLAGNDTLTVDLSNGDCVPDVNGITFNGASITADPGDKLIITGGSQGTVTYNDAGSTSGNIQMSSYGTVAYARVPKMVNSGVSRGAVVNLPMLSTLTLADDGTSGNGLSRLSAAKIVTTDFASPTGTLTINRGSSVDTVAVSDLPDYT